jgi:hypothetical protein
VGGLSPPGEDLSIDVARLADPAPRVAEIRQIAEIIHIQAEVSFFVSEQDRRRYLGPPPPTNGSAADFVLQPFGPGPGRHQFTGASGHPLPGGGRAGLPHQPGGGYARFADNDSGEAVMRTFRVRRTSRPTSGDVVTVPALRDEDRFGTVGLVPGPGPDQWGAGDGVVAYP